MSAQPYNSDSQGLSLRAKVTPRAGRDRIRGVVDLPSGPALSFAVAAPASDGRANAATIALLAKALDVPKSRVALLSGQSARIKSLRVSGDGRALEAKLKTLLSQP